MGKNEDLRNQQMEVDNCDDVVPNMEVEFNMILAQTSKAVA